MNCPSCQAEVFDEGQRFCKSCGALLPEPPADPLVGKVINGKYKIVKLLGEGGMGAVYHGEQSLGTNVRKVAIKTLHAQLSKDPTVQARFERECGTVAALEHPNTIQVYDFGTTDDGQLYIVMEFVKGRSLADSLEQDGPMEPARAEAIMKQICGSLEEAHSQGIVHRDLKPDNVVLTKRAGKADFVKVLDFGIAKRSGEEDKKEQKLTQQGMVLGTPPYMSPEQFTGKPIDARSDIYSLGVMSYEMLTGTLPFEAETAFEWATKHMTVAPTAIETHATGLRAPEKMRQAVMRALAKHVEDRFQTVKDFFDEFSVDPAAAAEAGMRGSTAVLPAGAGGGHVKIQSVAGDEPVSGRGPTQAQPSQAGTATPGAISSGGQPGGTALLPQGGGAGAGSPPVSPSNQYSMQPQPQAPQPPRPPLPGAAAMTPPLGSSSYGAPPTQPSPHAPVNPGKPSGGGAGKIVAIAIVLLLFIGGVAAAGVFVMKSRARAQSPPPGEADAAGLAATTSSAGDGDATVTGETLKNGDEDASASTPLGRDAGGLDASKPSGFDAGHAVPTTTTTATGPATATATADPTTSPTHVYVPECGYAAKAKAAGRMGEYNTLANLCRQKGGIAP